MDPDWTDTTVAIGTVVIAVAAVVIGVVESVRTRRQHKFEQDQASQQAAFQSDRLMREWRRDASRLVISSRSAEPEIRIANWSQLPFRRIDIHVNSYATDHEPEKFANGLNHGMLWPGEELVFDYSKRGDQSIDWTATYFWVEFSDHELRRWRFDSPGFLTHIVDGVSAVPEVIEEVTKLQHLQFPTSEEKEQMRIADIEVRRANREMT